MSFWKPLVAPALVSLAALAPLYSAAPAHAQFPPFGKPKVPKVDLPEITTDPSEAWSKAMWKVNSLAQEGLNLMPGTVSESSDPKKVAEKLGKAKKKLDEARKYYSTVPDPKSVNEGAHNYYVALETDLQNGTLANACLEAYRPIAKSFGEGKPVKDERLDAFDKAAAAFTSGAKGDDGARQAKAWTDTAVSFRKLNPEVADKKLKGELAIQRAAEEKAEAEAMDALFADLKRWEGVRNESVKPVPAEELAAFDARLKELVAFRAEAPLYFDDAKWDTLVYNAWFLEPEAAKAELAKLWQGEIVQSGTTNKKAFEVSVKADADHCYAFLPSWIERGGKSTLDVAWHGKKDAAFAHMWEVQRPQARGFCATKPVTLTLAGKMDYAGTTNPGIAWHVVKWARPAFPLTVAARLYTWPTDDCDAAHWKDRFMNPVPGTFYYGDGLPVVGRDTPDGKESAGADTKPPEAWKFEGGWMAPGSYASWRTRCGGEDAINPLGKQLEACFIANDKSFGPRYDAAQAAVDRANILTHEGAVARRDAIDAQWAKAQETRCMPIARKIEKQMIAAADELVDWFKANKPVPALDPKGARRKAELAVERSR